MPDYKKIAEEKYSAQSPAHWIAQGPTDLSALSSDSPASQQRLLRAAMGNMFMYGLNRWRWLAAENPYAMEKEGLEFIKGVGLLKGSPKCDWNNCDGFNRALKLFAETVLGINGIEMASICTNFITTPASLTIDGKYNPTVRTVNKDFEKTQLYYYQSHAFLRFQAEYYDVTCNRVFGQAALDVRAGQASEEKYCDVTKVNPSPLKVGGVAKDVFLVSNDSAEVNKGLGFRPGTKKYLIHLDQVGDNWSTWVLGEAERPEDLWLAYQA